MTALKSWNVCAKADKGFVQQHASDFVAVLNSYLGHVKHFCSYNIRKKIVCNIGKEWWQVMYIQGHYEKAVMKHKY
jgi:RNA-directed DNA polymerase